MITFIQRAGSALNLNVHLHILAPDGACTFEHAKAQFHRVPASSPAELHQLLDPLMVRILRALVRGAVLIEEPEQADQIEAYYDAFRIMAQTVEREICKSDSVSHRAICSPSTTSA